MKKRLLSLTIALALCLGLVVPVAAADASGLDVAGAKAFFDVLSAYSNVDRLYANLLDMDGDKMPELIVITASKEATSNSFNYDYIDLDIWKIRDGKAVKNAHIVCNPSPGGVGGLSYVVSNGKNYIYYSTFTSFFGAFSGEDTFISASGIEEQFFYDGENVEPGSEGTSFYRVANGKNTPLTKAEYDQRISSYQGTGVFSNIFFESDGRVWCCTDDVRATYQAVLNLLAAKANEAPTTTPVPSTAASTAGTYAPYTIQGYDDSGPYTISFSTAKVEKGTIQIRSSSVGPDAPVMPYEPQAVTMVTIRPDTQITVVGGYSDIGAGSVVPVTEDGNNRYTRVFWGSVNGILSGVGNEAFFGIGFPDRPEGQDSVCIGIMGDYLLFVEYYPTTTPTVPVFRDVPSNAYYANAVNWAVSKAITNGTSTTAFSPEENCTQAQILTFLWRAAGKPTLDLGILPTWVDEAYQEAVLWAAYTDMIDIVTFDPDKPCTRSTAVSYIWQALNCPTPTTSARFTDVSQSASYAQAISWAVGASVTNGTSTTTFSPNDTCTRGQIVTFLYRAMG